MWLAWSDGFPRVICVPGDSRAVHRQRSVLLAASRCHGAAAPIRSSMLGTPGSGGRAYTRTCVATSVPSVASAPVCALGVRQCRGRRARPLRRGACVDIVGAHVRHSVRVESVQQPPRQWHLRVGGEELGVAIACARRALADFDAASAPLRLTAALCTCRHLCLAKQLQVLQPTQQPGLRGVHLAY